MNAFRSRVSSGGAELKPVFLKIAPEDIVYLKSILESYEELGIIRTLNRLTGEVVILALEDTEKPLLEMLEALKGEIDFRIVPPPDIPSEDWLLSEYLEKDG